MTDTDATGDYSVSLDVPDSGNSATNAYWRLGALNDGYEPGSGYAYDGYTDNQGPSPGALLYAAGNEQHWIRGSSYIRVEVTRRSSFAGSCYAVCTGENVTDPGPQGTPGEGEYGVFAKKIQLHGVKDDADFDVNAGLRRSDNTGDLHNGDVSIRAERNVVIWARQNFNTYVDGDTYRGETGTSVTFNGGDNTLDITTGFAMAIFLGYTVDMMVGPVTTIAFSVQFDLFIGGKTELVLGSQIAVYGGGNLDFNLSQYMSYKPNAVWNSLLTVATGGTNLLAAALTVNNGAIESKTHGIMAEDTTLQAASFGVKSRVAALFSSTL